MSGWQRIKSRLATPTMRRLLGRPIIRIELARKHLRGDGIEIGALNAPLPLPRGARVRYVDRAAPDALHAYSDATSIQAPDMVADIHTLDGIADASLDFVIANHVLEHTENPLRALLAISRVLRNDGIAYIALPDKNLTFDRDRAITPLWHIKRDFDDGAAWSRHDHYVDWAIHVERPDDIAARIDEMERTSYDIHFHVWDFAAMQEMFDYAAKHIGLTIVLAKHNRNEIIWILRKP